MVGFFLLLPEKEVGVGISAQFSLSARNPSVGQESSGVETIDTRVPGGYEGCEDGSRP